MNKRITEDYCTKEVSALLKEKGFDVCVKNYFSLNKDAMLHNLDKKYGAKKNWNAFEICISRPSQSLALKWLREVHNQNVTVKAHNNVARLKTIYYAEVQNLLDLTEKGFSVNGCTFKDTYEQAVEAALKYTLENLI